MPQLAHSGSTEPRPLLRVWVLMGGDGAGRDASLASGLHVFRQLHSQPDLQAEAFLLAPRLSGENARGRRRALLQKRNEEIKLMGGPAGWPGARLCLSPSESSAVPLHAWTCCCRGAKRSLSSGQGRRLQHGDQLCISHASLSVPPLPKMMQRYRSK